MSGKEFLIKVGLLLLAVLYKYCYLLGLTAISLFEKTGTWLYAGLCHTEKSAAERWRAFRRRRKRRAELRKERKEIRRDRQASSMRAFRTQLRNGNTRDAMKFLAAALRHTFNIALHAVRTFLNYALPLCGLLLLFYVMNRESNMRYALRIFYGTEAAGYTEFGYVENELVYESALHEVQSKLEGTGETLPEGQALLELTQISETQRLLDPYELSNLIIAASGTDIDTAYGLYIDNDFVDAVADPGPLMDLLSLLQDRYKTSPLETVSFVKPVAIRSGLYPRNRIVNLSEINRQINRETKGEFTYTVQEGDSPWGIAQKFDVPQSQIIANNPGIEEHLLVGDEVIIGRAEPYLMVKIQRLEEYTQEVAFQTEYVEDENTLKGMTSVIREGETGLDRVRARVTYLNDIETERTELSRSVITEPVSKQIKIGTKLFGGGTGGGGSVTRNFIYPAPGTYISAGMYGYVNHTGVDFAGSYGLPIYASAPGTVTTAIYRGAYGRHVIINHGGGIETLYAHMSQMVVRPGEYVEQGQVIGYIGSSGNSTGPHVHLEIRINGTPVDPMRYL